ncbi:hypothetical protein LZD49_12560 [Dyadobacter sp. CY261]|uniref:hypothetical protein n=1 Tax=Dyadobacter sp. CY261 TaxID=2907203 RepID=UPI001F2767E3|nr:hypothetical protein [Dyadobacter sp. CY261]MCF0071305.1 hypothetical protein [Dyadobacter sp. CY261]
MKIAFKVSAILFLSAASFFACKDASSDVLDSGSAGDHRSARTATTTYITSAVTLPAGAYDVIDIGNGGHLSYSAGTTTINSVVHSNTPGTAASITIPSGANVKVSSPETVPASVNITNNGYLEVQMIVNFGANIYNNGTHKAASLTINGGKYYERGTSEVGQVVPLSPPYWGQLTLHGPGSLIFENCGYLIAAHITTDAANKVTGTGRIKVLTSSNLQYSLTASSTIKLCTDTGVTVTNYGSAVLSCATNCN